jgi:hypothetical protein
LLSHYILPESLADVIRFWSYLCQIFIKSLKIWSNDGYLQALLCYITRLIFRVMIVEIEMISIGTTKITPKNRSELVCFGCVDRKRPVLGGPVRSPPYLGRSWTGCSPRLRVLGTKNRTELDLKTLAMSCFFHPPTTSHHVALPPTTSPCLHTSFNRPTPPRMPTKSKKTTPAELWKHQTLTSNL